MDEVAVSTNHEPKDFETYGFGLKVFGSYKLKTNSIDGDIDMICIVPDYFSKEKHFFGMLTNLMRQQEKIRDIFPIRTQSAIQPMQ